MTASPEKERNVLIRGAGILLQILWLVELCGVDKNATDNACGVFQTDSYQADVSLMKGPHGRHEGDGMPRIPFRAEVLFKCLNSSENFHRAKIFSFGAVIKFECVRGDEYF